MFDVIGDVHGCFAELEKLLRKLKYEKTGSSYRKSDRKALFLGDLIDRGPQVKETVRLVRSMVESGAAICLLGNHEYNALCFHTLGTEGEPLRARSPKNCVQHATTLAAFFNDRNEWQSHLAWFRTLPMWFELNGIRAVHAEWCPDLFDAVIEAKNGVLITDDFLAKSCDKKKNRRLYDAVERILKGKEAMLPRGQLIMDKDGNERNEIRVKWFKDMAKASYRTHAFPEDSDLPASRIPASQMSGLKGYDKKEPPVFFGHYWLQGTPRLLASNVACLDFSVALGGSLCAYQWDGEQKLSPKKLVSVPSR